MNDFIFHIPTKIFFGRDCECNVGAALAAYVPDHILVLYGGSSARASGLLERIESSLDRASLNHIELGGVRSNPDVSFIRSNLEFCRNHEIDFILAVGGGSVIDTAKSLALCIPGGLDPWDVVMGVVKPAKALPVAVVLTISSAGSETSAAHVLNNQALNIKKGCQNEHTRPLAAFLNPINTFSVGARQTACGIVDSMMHTMERYYSEVEGTEIVDRLALSILQTIKNNGPIAMAKPDDYDARAQLMWCATLSASTLTLAGKGPKVMPVHQLGNGISGTHPEIAHAEGLSILFPAWALYMVDYDLQKFYNMAVNVWGVKENEHCMKDVAISGIKAMKSFFKSLGMPIALSDMKIGEDELELLADGITAKGTKTVPSYIPLGRQEIIDIFHIAK